MRYALVLWSAAIFSGCLPYTQMPSLIDAWSFQNLGGTMFSNPEQLSMKEVHLGNGALGGRQVVVEGKVAEVSDHGTYMVLSDETARLLVVLSEADDFDSSGLAGAVKSMRVLGTVESGKKGLPYIRAVSVSPTQGS